MNNNKYFISVILPTYNCSRFLEKSISSVLNQNYKNFELIIVDDCSTEIFEKKIEFNLFNYIGYKTKKIVLMSMIKKKYIC